MKIEGKLFIVEFGKPDGVSTWTSFGTSTPALFVIANSYDEAAAKALEFTINNQKTQPVLDGNGDLIRREEQEIQVKSVKVASDNVLF